MSEFVLADISGKKRYVKRDSNGRNTIVTSIKLATKFTEKIKAENFIKNSMSAKNRNKWVVLSNDTDNDRDKSESDKFEKEGDLSISEYVESDDLKWLYKVLELEKLNEDLLKEKAELESQQSAVDQELSDVYHFIKDHNPPAHIRTKVYKVQQNVLQRRECIKKKLTYLRIVLGAFNENLSKVAISERLKNVYSCDYKDRTGVYSELERMLRG